MITLRIGNKSAFFFCGDIKLSRKSFPKVSLEVSSIPANIAQGLMRGISGGTVIVSEEDKLAIQSIIDASKESAVKEVSVTSSEEEKPVTTEEVKSVEASEEAPAVVTPAPKQARQKKAAPATTEKPSEE